MEKRSPVENDIVNRIIDLRKSKKLTQEFMAESLHISRASYISFEKQPKDLSLGMLYKISDILHVPLESLLRAPFDEKKFIQLYFFILSSFPMGVPKTKFAKLLYLCDFGFYYEHRHPITYANYIHRQYGPVADLFLELTDELALNGKILINYLANGAQIISSLVYNNDFSSLSAEETSFATQVCALWKDKKTAEIVNYTHEQAPWAKTKDNEFIPYSLILQENKEHIYQPVSTSRYGSSDFYLADC